MVINRKISRNKLNKKCGRPIQLSTNLECLQCARFCVRFLQYKYEPGGHSAYCPRPIQIKEAAERDKPRLKNLEHCTLILDAKTECCQDVSSPPIISQV